MDDQTWINLQKLVGRGPQPQPSDDDPPDHIQLAQALDAMGAGPPPSDADADQYRQALADAVANFGRPTQVPDNTGTANLQLASYRVPDSQNGANGAGRRPADAGTLYAGSPAENDILWQHMADANSPAAPNRAPSPPAPAPASATPPPLQTAIDPIPGYDETGDYAWRAANDKIFLDAVNGYNAANGYRPGDPGYWTADMLKAQAMVESGSNKNVFMTDPLQVNTPGNWDRVNKPKVTGLTSPTQTMTPAISADAALKWLQFKGHPHDDSGRPLPYIGDEGALWRYSGDTNRRSHYTHDPDDDGLTQRDWYASNIPRLAREAADARSSRSGRR